MLRITPWLPALMLGLGCATPVVPRGEMPAQPTDEQLSNHGTPEERAALRRRYGITLEGEKVRVGEAVRGARGGVLGTEVNADLQAFAGEAAPQASDTGRKAMVLGGAAVQAASLMFLAVASPLPVLGGLLSVSALELAGTTLVAFPLARRHGVAVQVVNAIHATLFVSWLVGMILLPVFIAQAVSVVLLEQSRRSTNDAAWTTVDNYNRRLNRRIQALSTAPAASGKPLPAQPAPGTTDAAGLPATPTPAPTDATSEAP